MGLIFCTWWRQANGEAIAGALKGDTLPSIFSEQYAKLTNYERGKGGSDLTQSDSLSWRDKSGVGGVQAGPHAKAYDWNRLKRERLIHDTLASRPVLLVLARDNRSFFAYERPSPTARFTLRHDTLMSQNQAYLLTGRALHAVPDLPRLVAHQEFWHSWRTFHAGTGRY